MATLLVCEVPRETIDCARALLLPGMREDSTLEMSTTGDVPHHHRLHVKITTSLLLTLAIPQDDHPLLLFILAG